MRRRWRYRYTFILAIGLLGLWSACRASPPAKPTSASLGETGSPTTLVPAPTEAPVYHYSQLLPRDGIRPIYEPEFAPADQVPLADEELVLGVEIDGQAKAYPIAVLTAREMVNDELAGIPILATW